MKLREKYGAKGTWQWSCYHDYKGQRKEWRLGTMDEEEAQRLAWQRVFEFEKETDNPSLMQRGDLLTLEQLRDWKLEDGMRKDLHPQYRDECVRVYFRNLAIYPWNMRRITLDDKWEWAKLRRQMLTRTKRPPFYRTLKRELGALHEGLRAAQDKGFEGNWNFRMPAFPKEELDDKRIGHHLPPEELNRWRAFLPDLHRNRVLVMLSTGLRYAEMRRVRPEWIRMFSRAPTDGVAAYLDMPFRATKASKPRTLALTEAVHAALLKIMGEHIPDYRHHFGKAAKKAGLSRVPTERDLRRNFAEVVGDLVSPEVRDLMMGHAKPGSSDRYQSTHDRRVAEAALKIATIFPAVTLENLPGNRAIRVGSVSGRDEVAQPHLRIVP